MNFSGHFTKVSSLFLVLALVTLGVGYGVWSETLAVQGTVHTGEVDVNFTEFDCYDTENYASIGAALIDPNKLQVTVNNGYPGYVGHCWVDYIVAGTIPVYIKEIGFTPGSNLTGCGFTTYNPSTGSFTATCDQLEIRWSNGLCTYFNIDEGEGSNVHVKVLPGAGESTSHNFTVKYTFEQASATNCP